MSVPNESRRDVYLQTADDIDHKLQTCVSALEAVAWLLRDLPRLPDRCSLPDRRRHRKQSR